jgi:hypothetical protein
VPTAERFAELQAQFKAHTLLRSPMFAVALTAPVVTKPTEATVVFGRIPTPPVYGFTAPVLGIVFGDERPAEVVELVLWAEGGDLVSIDAFDLRYRSEQPRQAGAGRPAPPSGANPDLLLIATFERAEPLRRFRRAFHLVWSSAGHLVPSLASYALRRTESVASIAELERKVDELERADACPSLEQPMGRRVVAQSVQCMLEHDRRQ